MGILGLGILGLGIGRILLVPVIIVCALVGTVLILKLVQKFFPGSTKTKERANELAERRR